MSTFDKADHSEDVSAFLREPRDVSSANPLLRSHSSSWELLRSGRTFNMNAADLKAAARVQRRMQKAGPVDPTSTSFRGDIAKLQDPLGTFAVRSATQSPRQYIGPRRTSLPTFPSDGGEGNAPPARAIVAASEPPIDASTAGENAQDDGGAEGAEVPLLAGSKPKNPRQPHLSFALPLERGRDTSPTSPGDSAGLFSDDDADGEPTAPPRPRHLLGQFRATAISGNDITSSVLYTLGISFATAGRLAPFTLTLVVLVLYMFRSIYSEACSAIPLNGGALTILSYTATAVVSADSFGSYFLSINSAIGHAVPKELLAVGILLVFALLSLLGLSESANVATGIFVTHILTLTALVIGGVYFLIHDSGDILTQNWGCEVNVTGLEEPPAGPSLWVPNLYNDSASNHHAYPGCGYGVRYFAHDLWMGFSAGMLGVTGFETSANFIEEQTPGVFPKTLRNMWYSVALFNPLLSVLCMGVVPNIAAIPTQEADAILSRMADLVGGDAFRVVVAVDAAIVLAGSVLTSYVGILGLVRRLALDRCVPEFLAFRNVARGSQHYAIILFFCLASSLYLAVGGNTRTLGGVYAIAFLSVMAMFALGDMILKYKRNSMPRATRAPWGVVIAGFLLVITALAGNCVSGGGTLKWFTLYASVTLLMFFLVFQRVRILKLFLFAISKTRFENSLSPSLRLLVWNAQRLHVMFFIKDSTLAPLIKGVMYVRDEELCDRMTIVHCCQHLASSSDSDKVHVDMPLEMRGRASSSAMLSTLELTRRRTSLANMVGMDGMQVPLVSGESIARSPSGGRREASFGAEVPLLEAIAEAQIVPENPDLGPVAAPPKPATTRAFRDFGDEELSEGSADTPRWVQCDHKDSLRGAVALLDAMMPKLQVDLLLLDMPFTPATVSQLETSFGVQKNHMFITAPSSRFPYSIVSFGGVRIITH